MNNSILGKSGLWLIVLGVSLWNNFFAQTFADTLGVTKGGIYPQSELIVTTQLKEVEIFYTTDGTAPSSSAAKWPGELTLTSTTVLRFKVFREGAVIGTTTQTYIIGRTFDMAVISIAVEPDDFFGFERGIYVKGCCAAETPPYQGANFWKKWERPINIEFYEPDGTLGFNQTAGARIFGGFSKGWPMKSLAIIAREKYGPKRFKHQIFPNKDIKKFKSFVLRNSGGDFNKTHFRDAFMTDLVEPLDMEIQAYRPAVVFINGEYWGIHNIREKITEHYIASNCEVDKDSLDIMRHRNDVQFGSNKEYKKLLSFLEKNSFVENEMIKELDKWMDIDNYINYNIAEVYIDNRDAGGNIRYWRERKEGARWRWIFYDTDLSFGISDWKAYKVNTLQQMTTASAEIWPNPSWSTFIIRKLLENDSIKQVYSNRFADHLNTIFSAEQVIFKIDSIKSLITNEMTNHIKRWPSLSLKSWEKNVQVLRDFATYRPPYMRKFIMEKFGWEDTAYVQLGDFNHNEGVVKINSLSLSSAFSGWYFAGCPISIAAVAHPGYEFESWEGIGATTPLLYIDPKLVSQVFYPKFRKKGASQFAGKIVLNEINCAQAEGVEHGDWIELVNTSANNVDISGWKLYNKDGDIFEWKNHQIGGSGYLVLAKSPKEMLNAYPDIEEVLYEEKFKLKLGKKKESLLLLDANGLVVDSLNYSMSEDFGNSSSPETIILSKKNPGLPPIPTSWDVLNSGSPGKQNSNYKELPSLQYGELESWFRALRNQLIVGGGALLVIIILILLRMRSKRKKNDKNSSNDDEK
jgi:hypothetical protein